MRKKALLVLLTLSLMVFTLPVMAQEITVKVNGEIVIFEDVKPFIEEGRTFVPVRAPLEALGEDFGWNQELKTLAVGGYNREIGFSDKEWIPRSVFTVGKEEYLQRHLFNKENTVQMDVAPVIKDGRTAFPIRYLADALGFETKWDEATRTVEIIKAGRYDKLTKDREFTRAFKDKKAQFPAGVETVKYELPEGDFYDHMFNVVFPKDWEILSPHQKGQQMTLQSSTGERIYFFCGSENINGVRLEGSKIDQLYFMKNMYIEGMKNLNINYTVANEKEFSYPEITGIYYEILKERGYFSPVNGMLENLKVYRFYSGDFYYSIGVTFTDQTTPEVLKTIDAIVYSFEIPLGLKK